MRLPTCKKKCVLKYNYILVFSNQNLTMKQQLWISPSDIPLKPILLGDPKKIWCCNLILSGFDILAPAHFLVDLGFQNSGFWEGHVIWFNHSSGRYSEILWPS